MTNSVGNPSIESNAFTMTRDCGLNSITNKIVFIYAVYLQTYASSRSPWEAYMRQFCPVVGPPGGWLSGARRLCIKRHEVSCHQSLTKFKRRCPQPLVVDDFRRIVHVGTAVPLYSSTLVPLDSIMHSERIRLSCTRCTVRKHRVGDRTHL